MSASLLWTAVVQRPSHRTYCGGKCPPMGGGDVRGRKGRGELSGGKLSRGRKCPFPVRVRVRCSVRFDVSGRVRDAVRFAVAVRICVTFKVRVKEPSLHDD